MNSASLFNVGHGLYGLVHPSVRRRREMWERTPPTGPECLMHAGDDAGHLTCDVTDSEEQGRQCYRWLPGGGSSLAVTLGKLPTVLATNSH